MADVLAQANVSMMRPEAAGDPALVSMLDRIDLLVAMTPACSGSERTTQPGLLPGTGSDALVVLNVSIWTSYEELHRFVYGSPHMALVRRRGRWFERLARPSTVLWWVPSGRFPSRAETLSRLEVLRVDGPTAVAFTPRRRVDPQGWQVAAPTRSRAS